MKILIKVLITSFIFLFSKTVFSQSKNLLNELKVETKGLSTDAIYFENYLGKKSNLNFSYGEAIVFRFEGLKGFNLDENLAYPNANIVIKDMQGKVVFEQLGLFDEITQGYIEEDLNLRGNVTFAKPMLPNKSYNLSVFISDKRSDAFFKLNTDFKIENSDLFETNSNDLSYEILYLYSKKRDLALIDNRISPNEKIYILLEGLDGYKSNDGKAILSVNLKLEDSNQTIINEIIDMLPEPVSVIDLKEQIFAEVRVSEGEISNPVTCTLTIKDRMSGKEFKTQVNLIVN